MHPDRTALGEVAVSAGVTVAVVVVFAACVLGLARLEGTRAQQDGTSAPGLGQTTLCFLACAAVVAYRIHLIVPRFH
ncbi:hypothetical protein [Streptomyces massasporeus]|uniref:hypothetical protein n=1 Tax=Streptomyces massasporeus TaxID=67324 RepID=UPI00381152AD